MPWNTMPAKRSSCGDAISFNSPARVKCIINMPRKTEHELDLDTQEYRCIILTTTPNESVGRVHDRMPFIVHPGAYDDWLKDGELPKYLLEHPCRDEMYFCPVSRALNNVRNEGPELIRPAPVQKDLL